MTDSLPSPSHEALRHVEVGGQRWAYLDTGGEGPLVLCVHGLPTSSAEWHGVVAELAGHARMIVPDLPGFGLSDAAGAHGLRGLAGHLRAFVEAVVGDAPEIHLVLHDIGGPIGLSWAQRNLVRVASITLLNTTTFWWQLLPPPPALAAMVGGVPLVERLLTRRLFVAGLRATYQRPVPEGTAEAHWRPYEVDEAKRRALAEVLASYRRSVGMLAEVNRALPSMQMPVNVVWGARDPFCRLRSAVTFAERLPSARLRVLAGVGHFVPQEAPADVAHEIRGAIARAHAREEPPTRPSSHPGRLPPET